MGRATSNVIGRPFAAEGPIEWAILAPVAAETLRELVVELWSSAAVGCHLREFYVRTPTPK